MKKIIATAVLSLFLLPLIVIAEDKPLETTRDKVSYSIGLDLGKYLTSMKDKVDYEILKQGIEVYIDDRRVWLQRLITTPKHQPSDAMRGAPAVSRNS